MGWYACKWILFLLGICLFRYCQAGKTLDLVPNTINSLQYDEIIRALSQNETESSENFTFVEFVDNIVNYNAVRNRYSHRDGVWRIKDSPEDYHTNPHYGEYFFMYR